MTHQHRGGNVDQIVAPVKLTSTVPTNTINKGDPCAIVSGFLVPAGAFTWDTDEATTQTGFAAAFAGFSDGRSIAGSTDPRVLELPINMGGNIEVDVASATYEIGTFVACDSGSSLLKPGTLKATSTKAKAIGVIIRREGAATTRALIRPINTPVSR